jgi:hypothetical protein
MGDEKIVVTANSAVTINSSSPGTQSSISAALKSLHESDPNTQSAENDLYVTRVHDVRIVWRREKDGTIVVQSVFAPGG